MELARSMVHVLRQQAERLEDRPALWTRRADGWRPTSWRDYERRVRHFALGLVALGFAKGDRLAIMGFNREEWVVADLGAMAAGGVPVGLYTTLSPEQLAYIIGHSEASLVLVENDVQLAALLALKPQLPKLRTVVVMAPKAPLPEGVRGYDEVLELGRRGDETVLHERLQGLEPNGLATLIYTSGTTGHPKGVMLSHHNLVWTASRLSSYVQLGQREVLLSYLPLSHIAEQICSIHGPLVNGMQVYFAESFEKLPDNLREVRPTVFFGVPRVWEKFKAKAEQGIATQPRARQRVLRWARAVALRWHRANQAHRRVATRLHAQYRLAQRLVFEPLKKRIGLDRAWLTATSAAPIGLDVLEFFASIDLVLLEVYGQSEVTGPTSVNAPGQARLGTLGRPMSGVEVRIAADGEIQVRGPNVCLGYFKDAAASAELVVDGWLCSGDLGTLDDDGYLKVTGRKKEIIVTAGGKKTAPAGIEALLRGLEPVSQAMVVGDRQSHLVALLTLDAEKAAAHAKAHGWPESPRALATHPGFLADLRARIDAHVNPRLARFETIKRFAVLPDDFSVEGGELTSTLKLRRQVAAQKHQATIAALYAGKDDAAAA